MATTFPESIQTFPRMMDIEQSDLQLVNQYQTAMKNQDYALARQILVQIPNYARKIIQANYLNDMNDTIEAVQDYFAARYSPAYVVSSTMPTFQENGDFWFEVTA